MAPTGHSVELHSQPKKKEKKADYFTISLYLEQNRTVYVYQVLIHCPLGAEAILWS